MKYIKKYKVLFICLIFLFVFILSFILKDKEVQADEIEVFNDVVNEDTVNKIKIEIKGAVNNSGVYELDANSRIIDAVNISGGVLKNADTSSINMSSKLTDEMVIVIPYQENLKNKVIKIDIKGAVTNPGVFQLNEGDRVIDVIKLSGGLLSLADTSSINLSKKVFDEMVIIVPYKKIGNEKVDENEELDIEQDNINDAVIGENKEENKDEISNEENKDGIKEEINKKVSLNNSTKEELMTLSGIGESKALAIIEYRNKNKFKSIEEVMNVSGIGQALYEKIKNNITL